VLKIFFGSAQALPSRKTAVSPFANRYSPFAAVFLGLGKIVALTKFSLAG